MELRTSLEKKVLRRIRPKKRDIDHIQFVADYLVKAVDNSGVAQGMLVGSVARHTWLNGDRDLDIFMLFDPTLSRLELEEKGLSLARSIATDFGTSYQEKYAEHPYINAQIEGFDVDLVPCFRVSNAQEIKSAVDRTPFHTRYIAERIGTLADDVLLFKQFAKAGGFYGSDQMTEGVAGYLCELLILHYGGFSPLLRATSQWKKHTFIDIEGIAAKQFEDPLVVIDPVDPNRNVAASVSLTKKFEFVELARGYLEDPSPLFFEVKENLILRREEFETAVSERGTTLLALLFSTPPYIPDVVVPQLRKSLTGIRDHLERNGFLVNRADYSMNERQCMLLFELLSDRLPPLKRHIGPPLWSKENAAKFSSKIRPSTFSGPFIEDGTYIIEIPRTYTSARDLLSSKELLQTGLGKHIKLAMTENWTTHEGKDCWHEDFDSFLSNFIIKLSPLMSLHRWQKQKKRGQ